MLPSFPDFTTQIELDGNDVDLDSLKSSVLSNKLVMLKWIQTTEQQLKDEIQKTKKQILTESKKEINYVDEILKEKLTITERCAFKATNQCKRSSLPYSNYCTEHISQNEDQQLFKRCSFKLTNEQQCPNSSLANLDKEVCEKHLKLIKNADKTINKQDKAKSRRRCAKNNSTNENKPRKARKKKDANDLGSNLNSLDNSFSCPINLITNNQSELDNNLIDNLNSDSIKNFTTNSQTTFSPFTNSSICYSASTNSTTTNQFGTYSADHHALIDYAPCITNSTNENLTNNLNNNLNQLSNLNHSEDSLVAIVNNSDDLSSVPFEESELSEMLGKIGKIPEDAFNDLFMDNLSTESSELRAIDNIVFNNTDNLDNLEPSISNQTFSSTLNFKNGSNYFNDQPNGLQLNNLIYTNGQPNIDLTNLNGTNNELICLPQNSLISTDHRQIKNMTDPHFTGNGICTLSTVNPHLPNSTFNSCNVIDYKQSSTIQPTFLAPVINQNYSATNSVVANSNNFSSNYLHNVPNNYSSSSLNGQSHLLNNAQPILNGHSNHLMNSSTNLLNDTNYNALSSTDLVAINTTSNLCAPTNYLDCAVKTEQDKKFNLFTNCKNNANYSTTYSNIYDDLPSFESNRLNGNSSGSSLPSFSIMIKKNRIESR